MPIPENTHPDTLDPDDWNALREQGHRMLDDMFDYLEQIRTRPVWQPIPDSVRDQFRQPLPQQPSDIAAAHQTFMQSILPYAAGNAHPGFMGWVHGGGTPVGMLAEMLAAGLNANLGGRDQMPVEVERQVLRWVRELFGFPDTASGLFVTGTSMATLIAILVASRAELGTRVRTEGIAADGKRLTAYASTGAHGSIAKMMDIAGIGTDALRAIPVNANHQMDIARLEQTIAADRAQGFTPFFVAATAGTVNTGAIDPLGAVADVAKREGLWFHVDGAYGALAMLSPEMAPRLAGLERADSVAFDFHKWGQVPYDAGFILVRDSRAHLETFSSPAAYLRRDTRGLAAGSPWPCDFGPDLSRGFRALKAWFTLQVYGAEKMGKVIAHTCELARYLERCIAQTPELELLAPVSLNIVCFRHRGSGTGRMDVDGMHAERADVDRVNAEIVVALHESGIAAPSTTTLDGKVAIRAAIFNHRTNKGDIDALIRATLEFGAARMAA
ncbi:MAG: aspartate aminotransferase family protein [Gallionella sp.]